MKAITYLIYGVSNILYRLFGYNTPSRRERLEIEAIKLQDELDEQHWKRVLYNQAHGTDWTTKKVMEIIGD